jgi:hypothetical protein
MNPSEISLAHGTWALVLINIFLVVVTLGMAWWQSRDMRRDLRARLLLTFIDRFDGSRLLKARRELARRLLPNNASRDQIEETVLNFFEDMGLLLRLGYLDEKLMWSTFGFFAVRWWSACEDYIVNERETQNDSTLFKDFEDLTKRFKARDVRAGLTVAKATPPDLKQFLEDERDL